MPKISVIVPVYNTEKYLKRCLESILNQTYKDFEIIIINDGSTDNSKKIINEYIKNNPEKVKSYFQRNSGLSMARNFGIKKATGDYISFIDSDDFIDKNLFKNLENEIEKGTDLIKFKLITVNDNYKEKEKIAGPTFKNINGQEAFNRLVFKDSLLEPACIYLYKKDLFVENNFEFSPNTYHEDFGLIPLVIIKSKTVTSLDVYGYYYLQTEQSITRNNDYKKTIKRMNDILKHYDNMINQIKKWKLEEKTKNNIKQYYTNAIINATNQLNKIDRKKYLKEIKNRKLLKNINVKNFRTFARKIVLKLKGY